MLEIKICPHPFKAREELGGWRRNLIFYHLGVGFIEATTKTIQPRHYGICFARVVLVEKKEGGVAFFLKM